jgi:Flp pilus assembly protein CpaB
MSGLRFTRPFTILGIVLALVVITAFVLVALNAQNSAASPSISVVVANRDLQPRVAIDAAALDIKSIPVPGTYPKVYFTRLQDVQGLVPLVTIPLGQAITSNEVAKPSAALGSQSEYLPIPSGYVAVTIPTSEQQGVANYIQPEDYISVIATVTSAGKVASKTIFTNLHVIRVGAPPAPGTTTSNSTSLTVVVTECQAEVITWFLDYAALKYVLESFHDYLQPGVVNPDPACPTVTAAKGVTLQVIQTAYPSLF